MSLFGFNSKKPLTYECKHLSKITEKYLKIVTNLQNEFEPVKLNVQTLINDNGVDINDLQELKKLNNNLCIQEFCFFREKVEYIYYDIVLFELQLNKLREQVLLEKFNNYTKLCRWDLDRTNVTWVEYNATKADLDKNNRELEIINQNFKLVWHEIMPQISELYEIKIGKLIMIVLKQN